MGSFFKRKGFFPSLAALALACSSFSVAPIVPFATPAMAEPSKPAVEADFRLWIGRTLWPQAQKAGISAATFQSAMANVKLVWQLPDLSPPGFPPPKEQKQTQAEFSSPAPYFNEARLAALATDGRVLLVRYASDIARIEKAYGVPGPVLLAIWARETGYGKAKLPYNAVDVLATNAFMSTRRALFETELIDALKILDRGDIRLGDMTSSSAGALGQPQFMPSSFLQFAVDFDGDGHRNIWTSVPDSLASIARFLVAKGYQRASGSLIREVTLPMSVSCANEGPDKPKTLGEWQAAGVKPVEGGAFSPVELSSRAMLLLPAGTHGPEFLVSPNLYAIKEYNNSDLYALFIAQLADRIGKGKGAFKTPFGNVGHMLRSDVLAMQQALMRQGYDVGKADGLPGYKTRRSLGDWQKKQGLPPSCYPDESLKSALK